MRRACQVTVAVPACGRPKALARCLDALAAGTVLPASVIVVDQAPNDAARRAVAAHESLGARYVEQARLGVSASRNLALSLAATTVFAVTDDDCVPESGWVEAIADTMADGSRRAGLTGPILPLGQQLPGTRPVSLRLSMTPAEHVGRVPPWHVGSGGNFAARRDALVSAGGWDERLGPGSAGKAAEDLELLYRLMRRGALIRYEPAAVVRHEWQPLERRLATRSSYGYGMGAFCGLWLVRGDLFAVAMLIDYARTNARRAARAGWEHDATKLSEHVRSLTALLPGVAYGLRSARAGRLGDAPVVRKPEA